MFLAEHFVCFLLLVEHFVYFILSYYFFLLLVEHFVCFILNYYYWWIIKKKKGISEPKESIGGGGGEPTRKGIGEKIGV